MVDQPKLDQLTGNLRRYVAVLRKLAEVPADQFLSNPDKIGNAKYHFVIAIEGCIDVANHIIASEHLRFPKDNVDSLAVLVENGWLDPGMQDQLTAMARFRNRLVHLYWQIDDTRIYEYLKNSLADFDMFVGQVALRVGS